MYLGYKYYFSLVLNRFHIDQRDFTEKNFKKIIYLFIYLFLRKKEKTYKIINKNFNLMQKKKKKIEILLIEINLD